MVWEAKDLKDQMRVLQALANYRYDEYQQFSPGMRFLESLVLWLEQFKSIHEREVAFDFVRSRLVFITEEEMSHLVRITYPDVIIPLLLSKASTILRVPSWKLRTLVESPEYKQLRRQTLFLGLSDGSRVDIFRRFNPEISNEQILRSHEISPERAQETIKKLGISLCQASKSGATISNPHFRLVYLLDDFSASGTSYIRRNNGDGPFKGKVASFYYDVCLNKKLGLVSTDDLHVVLLLYVATSKARHNLETLGKELFGDIQFDVQVVYLLNDSVKLDPVNDSEFLKLVKEPAYYDASIQDESYEVGKHDEPYLGFDECALSLVLCHNTPNNSLPLLWFDGEVYKVRGLFPRVSRQREGI